MPKRPVNQVHRHEDRSNQRNLAKEPIDLVAMRDVLNIDSGPENCYALC